MRFLVLILLVLVATVLFAQQFVDKPGYVIIAVGEHAFRLSFIFFVLLSVAVIAAVYAVLRLLRRSWLAPRTFSRWRATRRSVRADRALYRGFTALAEGKWQQAEQLLTAGARNSEQPMLYYLGAAQAAQGSQRAEHSEVYLGLAEEADGEAAIAVGLARSEMLMSQADFAGAEQTLRTLRKRAPQHAEVLRLELKLCMEAEAWEQLLELVPALRKAKAVAAERSEELERAGYAGLLQQVGEGHFHPDPLALWQRVPKRFRSDVELIAAHARNLVAAGSLGDAEAFLRKQLKQTWRPDLFVLYAEIPMTEHTPRSSSNMVKAGLRNTAARPRCSKPWGSCAYAIPCGVRRVIISSKASN